MTFVNSSGIVMQNVVFSGCHARHNSTSRSQGLKEISFEEVRVSLYFLSCSNVEMYSATLCSSDTASLMMYNTGGTNVFENCHFDVCYGNNGGATGVGAMVEFTYCMPGDLTCMDKPSEIFVKDASYNFTGCSFCENNASVSVPYRPLYPHGAEHVAFGKGAGLSIHFKGKSHRNRIFINDCDFEGNKAELGSGLYVGFMDESINNTVLVSGRHFLQNQIGCHDASWKQAGGGARIEFIHYPPDVDLWPNYSNKVVNNSVTFSKVTFTTNMACVGGAVSFVTSRDRPNQSASNSLSFDRCNFSSNQARIGAAVDLSLFGPDTAEALGNVQTPVFTDCRFDSNVVSFLSNYTNYKSGMGNLYANQVPVRFVGNTIFESNIGTALAVKGTHVSVSPHSTLNFTANTGRIGGAISFIGRAWLVASENSTFLFANNSVNLNGQGGAIYAAQFGEHDTSMDKTCFFRYYKYTKSPEQWNTTFRFRGNTANSKPNSIYTTSVVPCLWPDQGGVTEKVFCNKPWYFEGSNNNCTAEVLTGPARVSLASKSVAAIPGWSMKLGIRIWDDYKTNIISVVTAVSDSSSFIVVNKSTEYIVDDKLVVHGIVNSGIGGVQLRTLDPRVTIYNLNVEILECPPGYRPTHCRDNKDMVCYCNCRSASGFKCNDDPDEANATVYFGYCLTRDWNRTEALVLGKCLYTVNDTILPRTADELDYEVCGRRYNRTGTLCGKCRPKKGVAINSYQLECIDCYPGNFFAYLGAEILPLTVFLIIVALFNISATSAPMNAYVFFSQMITVAYFHNRFPWAFGFGYKPIEGATEIALKDLFLIPYSIWNLDFLASVLKPFCFTHSFQPIDVLLFSYTKAFYPLVLIGVCYLCIELHDRNYKCVRVPWKPFRYLLYRFRRTWEPKTSIIDAFATFLLLSYTKLMYVSFSLLVPVHMVNMGEGNLTSTRRFYFDASLDYFGVDKHIWYALCALVVLVVFVLSPPIFLLLYPLRGVQKCLTKCSIRWRGLHTFADAFQGSFKDGTNGTRDWRYFASVYFFFRIIGFIIYASEPDLKLQYLVQQILVSLAIFVFAVMRPYKKDFYNGLDAGLFTLLAILNSMSFYNSNLVNVNEGISVPLFAINYALLFVPLVYIICYVVFVYLRLKGCFMRKFTPGSRVPSESMLIVEHSGSDNEPFSITVVHGEGVTNEEMPDRLLHPENYRSNSPRSSNKSSTNNKSSSAQSNSKSQELVYPLSDGMLLPNRPRGVYGSVQRRHTEPLPLNKHPQGTIN